MKLGEDAAADLGELLQEARAADALEPCRCKPLCGPAPFEMRVARWADRRPRTGATP